MDLYPDDGYLPNKIEENRARRANVSWSRGLAPCAVTMSIARF